MFYTKFVTTALLSSVIAFSSMLGSHSTFAKETLYYFDEHQLPNSLTLLPPPPTETSAQFWADETAYRKGRALNNTPRWQQAIEDANLAAVGSTFSQALGVEISDKNTPITQAFLQKVEIETTYFGAKLAKNYYKRIRPFMYFNTHTCTPNDEPALRQDGSYPSGHTAFGWATALILSQMVPQHQDALLKRGYEFGQSRVICGAHWQSDVNAGRIIGAEVVSRMQTDKQYQQDFKKAKAEILKKMK